MIRSITVEKLIAELQKHNPKLPIVLKVNTSSGPSFFRQLRYLDSKDPDAEVSDLFIFESEFANNMGQQGLCLVFNVNE